MPSAAMPALVAFGRRWQVGSDDFVFPGIIELVIRVAWLLAVMTLFCGYDAHFACNGHYLLHIYLVGVLVIIALVLTITSMLTYCSMKGTITDPIARRHVPKLLYVRTFTSVLEIVWNCLGSIWAFGAATQCDEESAIVQVVRTLAICNWVIFALLGIGVILAFDPVGKAPLSTSTAADDIPDFFSFPAGRHPAHKLWECRFRFLCCCAWKTKDESSKEAFHHIAGIMATLFHEIDVVASDIAAGLILVNLKEKLRRRDGRKAIDRAADPVQFQPSVGRTMENSLPSTPVRSAPSSLSPISETGNVFLPVTPTQKNGLKSNFAQDVPEWMTPVLAYHYSKFALGCYTWPWFMASHLLTGLCRLGMQCFTCACVHPAPSFVDSDNCCHCHTAALKKLTELRDEDLVYVSFRNRVCEVPFYVAVDHKMFSIVVAIRGSLSLRDALTDVLADCQGLDIEGLPHGCVAHKGMLQSARYVKERLDQTGAIEKALSIYPDYNLVFVGHSLGAGTATLLAMHYRPSHPTVQCFAYAPPTALVNVTAAQYTEGFVLSVIIGDDFAARLHMEAVENLKQKILTELTEAKLPKYRILACGCWSCLLGSSHEALERIHLANSSTTAASQSYQFLNSQATSKASSKTSSKPKAKINKYDSVTDKKKRLQRQQSTVSRLSVFPKCLPGKLMHIVRTDPFSKYARNDDSHNYTVRWSLQEDFQELVVTPRMFTDHLPDTLITTLKRVADQYTHRLWDVSVEN